MFHPGLCTLVCSAESTLQFTHRQFRSRTDLCPRHTNSQCPFQTRPTHAGPPNTPTCGDFNTAWAPRTLNTDPVTLNAFFDIPVRVTAFGVRETSNPGFVKRVDFVLVGGYVHTVWQGVDTTNCGDWFLFNSTTLTPYVTQQVQIIFQSDGDSWSEIDAFLLEGMAFDVKPPPNIPPPPSPAPPVPPLPPGRPLHAWHTVVWYGSNKCKCKYTISQ